jgi:DDE superfamily endonuclease
MESPQKPYSAPPELKLHLVMDNYGTHKEPHVQAWLKCHPRFVCHFAPTSSSGLNLVERFFNPIYIKRRLSADTLTRWWR